MGKTYTQLYSEAPANLTGAEKLAVDQANATKGTTTQAIADLSGAAAHANLTTTAHGGIVATTDPRLSDSRPASDVSAWAKAATKPAYTASEVGAEPANVNIQSHISSTNNPHGVTAAQVSASIDSLTAKTTPVDADEILISDSAASYAGKKTLWSSIKSTLKTYFDTLYQTVLTSGTNIKTVNGSSILGSGDLPVSGSDSTKLPLAGGTMTGAINWGTGLGAITHVQGPTDQALAVKATAPVQATSSVAGNALNLIASNATAGSSGNSAATGGAVNITAGNGAKVGTAYPAGGSVNITSGVGGSSSGAINIATPGDSGAGAITIQSGNSSYGVGPNINILAGAAGSAGSTGGAVNITGGTSSTYAGTATGGAVVLTGGAGANITTTYGSGGIGGPVNIAAGSGGSATNSGGGTAGAGSTISLTSGAGGSATGTSGTRTGGNSGNITFDIGAAGTGATANGTIGAVKIAPTRGTVMIGSSSNQLPTYADNATAVAAGLIVGTLYKTATGQLMVVYA